MSLPICGAADNNSLSTRFNFGRIDGSRQRDCRVNDGGGQWAARERGGHVATLARAAGEDRREREGGRRQ